MDKRSIIGLFIIGAILFAFSYFNPSQPENSETANAQTDTLTSENDSIVQLDTTPSKTIIEPINNLVPVLNEDGIQLTNNIGQYHYKDTVLDLDTFLTKKLDAVPLLEQIAVEEKTIRLENNKIAVDISNKGGNIQAVYLKEYNTYADFIKENEAPLQLFDRQSTYGVTFKDGEEILNANDFDFKVREQNKDVVILDMINPSGKSVSYRYALSENHYDVEFDVSFTGFNEDDASSTFLNTDFKLLSTEKHLPSEQRVSTIFFKYNEDSYDYLSIAGDDDEVLEEKTAWVAFKQSYFSAILMSENGFKGDENSTIEILNLPETDTTYIKHYKSNLDLGVSNFNNTVEMKWYFGPNDYDILAEYGNGSEDIVDLGWGLFRWINVYFMRPIFGWLMNMGIGAGIAILFLTIFVKLLLSPVNYKMYKSSAMMKVLRPEIEKITKKFPKKEDAMKKQQATMALYRETGVSPMAGCIPMLIQMPILFAIFRLFPAEIALRQEGFLWAEDLSTYDSILNFGFEIPFYGAHISLFTLLMAATTLLYTHYNSSNMQQPQMEGMPNMKYIMYFFPIMMIFFFNSYASGLSYYYFISTLMTIGIMFAIKKFMLDEDKILAKIESNKANPKKKKGKSKFQQRLEEAQKLQQERQRQKNRK